jgi:hypothetical protein
VHLTAQIRDLPRDKIQQPLPHQRADLTLENSLEILNPGLHRGQNAFISLHSVGWFKRLFKTDGVGTPSDQPALLHPNTLTEKNPRPDVAGYFVYNRFEAVPGMPVIWQRNGWAKE